ncbi:MAG: hypothetical protein NZL89_02190, partial [Leptospiraceae bacterium]|nr:hypothetical protein [Leptospiraceae bacterium]
LRLLLQRHKKNPQAQWQQLRSYRDYLRYTETKRRNFLRRRDRLLLAVERLGVEAAAATGKRKLALKQKLTKARKKFFSIDTRIPLRIVAAVSGDSIATVQRRQKEAIAWLKEAYVALGQQQTAPIRKFIGKGEK